MTIGSLVDMWEKAPSTFKICCELLCDDEVVHIPTGAILRTNGYGSIWTANDFVPLIGQERFQQMVNERLRYEMSGRSMTLWFMEFIAGFDEEIQEYFKVFQSDDTLWFAVWAWKEFKMMFIDGEWVKKGE